MDRKECPHDEDRELVETVVEDGQLRCLSCGVFVKPVTANEVKRLGQRLDMTTAKPIVVPFPTAAR
jgi:hypothetical protein